MADNFTEDDNFTARFNLSEVAASWQDFVITTIITLPEWMSVETVEDCDLEMAKKYPTAAGPYCEAKFDFVSCWPATPIGQEVRQPCPPWRGLVENGYSSRVCGPYGYWQDRRQPLNFSKTGWTDYTTCFTNELLKIYKTYYQGRTNEEIQIFNTLVQGTRILELIGMALSLTSLVVSLVVFFYFRALWCERNWIHKNLFIAILMHVMLRLGLYSDHNRSGIEHEEGHSVKASHFGLAEVPVLCKGLYILLEYTTTVAFLWMFLEGYSLHRRVVTSVFSRPLKQLQLFLIAWLSPIILVSSWALCQGLIYDLSSVDCWFGYALKPVYWVLEAPRASIMITNFCFLANVLRVLIGKVKTTQHQNAQESQQLKKAVRAAIFLLPLLGIPNFLNMVEGPSGDPVAFGIWTFSAQFIVTFQGFFVSLLYCFLNNEVQMVVRRRWSNFMEASSVAEPIRRISRAASFFPSTGGTNLTPTDVEARPRRVHFMSACEPLQADGNSDFHLLGLHDFNKPVAVRFHDDMDVPASSAALSSQSPSSAARSSETSPQQPRFLLDPAAAAGRYVSTIQTLPLIDDSMTL